MSTRVGDAKNGRHVIGSRQISVRDALPCCPVDGHFLSRHLCQRLWRRNFHLGQPPIENLWHPYLGAYTRIRVPRIAISKRHPLFYSIRTCICCRYSEKGGRGVMSIVDIIWCRYERVPYLSIPYIQIEWLGRRGRGAKKKRNRITVCKWSEFIIIFDGGTILLCPKHFFFVPLSWKKGGTRSPLFVTMTVVLFPLFFFLF